MASVINNVNFDAGVGEGFNPTRRYKWFRPRQAMRGYGRFASSTNRAAVILYNNSTGRDYLAVRTVLAPYYHDSVGLAVVQGAISGISAGVQAPVVAGEAVSAGLVQTIDAATVYTPDSEFAPSGDQLTNPFSMPISILPPNWNLVAQNVVTTGVLLICFLWEAIRPDELDYMW